MFKDELNAGSGDITVWINSPGGDCVAAAQIYNMLTEYPGKVTVKIDGMAASAASVIAMAGNEVLMSPVSMKMIHNPATVAFGDHAEMEKAIEMLDAVKESIINAYVLKTGLSRAKLSHLMDAETWMDANKAMELGFADGMLGQQDALDMAAAGAVAMANAMMFSRKAVNNALVNKLEAKYGKPKKTVKEQAEIGTGAENATVGSIAGEVAGAENATTTEANKMSDKAANKSAEDKVNSTGQTDGHETGRCAEDLRERLNFIKKFI